MTLKSQFLKAYEWQGPGKEVLKISPAGTGLWETYSVIYSDGQLKAELTVRRTFRSKPEPDALFRIREYAADSFCQPVIAEMYFFLYGSSRFYDGNLKDVRFWLHGQVRQKCHA